MLYMHTKRSSLILLIIVVTCSQLTAATQRSHSSEQSHFSAEDDRVKKPALIPNDVLAILQNNEVVRNIMESENIPAGKLPSSWFSASAIHLSASAKTDLVVVGNPPVSGANTATFWVFVATAHGYELALTGPAHDLIVNNSRSKGYRNIEMSAESAVQFYSALYRFDGKRYSVFRRKSVPIR